MIDGKIYRITELHDYQMGKDIENEIISILNRSNISLPQVRGIFNNILSRIEDSNLIKL